MDMIIITGMAGAGKSHAINTMEDIGYYCVDNMPPTLLLQFAKLAMQNEQGIGKMAVVVDSRGGKMFDEFYHQLDLLEQSTINYRLLFLDCTESRLLHRFKETRRKHPLFDTENPSLERAINKERDMMKSARLRANYIIDTTYLLPMQLKEKICGIFLGNISSSMIINCMSFGFKYGYPSEADLVFDVRCLPNPFYIKELKLKTGIDQSVRDYVMSFTQSKTLLSKLMDLIDFLIPHYVSEGKSQLVIAFGCTGGRHRSITFAELIYQHLMEQDQHVMINHRDIHK